MKCFGVGRCVLVFLALLLISEVVIDVVQPRIQTAYVPQDDVWPLSQSNNV